MTLLTACVPLGLFNPDMGSSSNTSTTEVYDTGSEEDAMVSDTARFPGITELVVLRLLSDREMYGYEMVQSIALRTGNVFEPGEGLIYPCCAAWKSMAP